MNARVERAATASRGYTVLYHPEAVNRCPGCGRAHWHIGRFSAECAFCATALPFAAPADARAVNFARIGREAGRKAA